MIWLDIDYQLLLITLTIVIIIMNECKICSVLFQQLIFVPVFGKLETQQLLIAIFNTADKSDCKLKTYLCNYCSGP